MGVSEYGCTRVTRRRPTPILSYSLTPIPRRSMNKFVKTFMDLDGYQNALQFAVEIHFITLELPKFELYEEGRQIRRSPHLIEFQQSISTRLW